MMASLIGRSICYQAVDSIYTDQVLMLRNVSARTHIYFSWKNLKAEELSDCGILDCSVTSTILIAYF